MMQLSIIHHGPGLPSIFKGRSWIDLQCIYKNVRYAFIWGKYWGVIFQNLLKEDASHLAKVILSKNIETY